MDLIQEYDSSSDSCDESMVKRFSISISQQTLDTLNLPFRLKFVNVKGSSSNDPPPKQTIEKNNPNNKKQISKSEEQEVEFDPLEILAEECSDDNVDHSYQMEFIENIDLDGSTNNRDDSSTNSSNTSVIKKATSRKYKSDPKNVRLIRKIKRNSGQEYVASSGKKVEKRTLKPLTKCRFNCRLKISEDERKKMFDEYWNGGSYETRCSYITNLIKVVPKARNRGRTNQKNRQYTIKYNLINKRGPFEVCKTCFLNTLGETSSFIKWLSHKISKNVPVAIDFRGKHPTYIRKKTPTKKVKQAEGHIKKYPEYMHQCIALMQRSEKRIVQGLDISGLYQSYCEEVESPLARKTFMSILKKLSTNMASSACLTPEVILTES